MTNRPKKSKIFLLLFLALSVLFLSSCSENPTEKGKEEPQKVEENGNEGNKEFRIAYYAGEQIDPFYNENRSNRAIISLCFEGLISLDSKGVASPCIADYEISSDLYSILFTIKDTAVFADGSPVTSDDVIYSLNEAKKSDIFSFRFEKYISSWEKKGEKTLRVYFRNKNRFNVNLFDIPVSKVNSDDRYLIGSGRYYISNVGGSLALSKNTHHKDADKIKINTISLVSITDAQDLNYNFNYGGLDAAYADLSDGSQRYKGKTELVSFMTNNLVYLGVNKSRSGIRYPSVCSAVSKIIDRKKISREILNSQADIVWQPFNPESDLMSGYDIKSDIYSTAEANEVFNNYGLSLYGTSRDKTFTIICNKGNQSRINVANMIADDLRNMGFSAKVELYNWDKYKSAISSGDYDFYVGETTVPNNFDIRYIYNDGLLPSGGTSELFSALDSFYSGRGDLINVLDAFTGDMSMIPLYYTRGALAINRVVDGDFLPSESSIFNGIETWVFATTDESETEK